MKKSIKSQNQGQQTSGEIRGFIHHQPPRQSPRIPRFPSKSETLTSKDGAKPYQQIYEAFLASRKRSNDMD
jgi:hypothetical protein